MKKELLDMFLSMSKKKEIIVQKQSGKYKGYRYLYPSGKYTITKYVREMGTPDRIEIIEEHTQDFDVMLREVNQRQILPFEIIIDIDNDYGLEVVEGMCGEIVDRIETDGVACIVWWSGNKGYHIQTIFKDLQNYSYEDRMSIRELFFDRYTKEFTEFIDYPKKSEEVTIQLENTPHRKSLIEKSLVYCSILPSKLQTTENMAMLTMYYIDILQYNINYVIPKDVVYSLSMLKLKNMLKSKKDVFANVNGWKGKSYENYDMKCVVYFMKKDIPKGNRDNVLFILISHFCKLHIMYDYSLYMRQQDIYNICSDFVTRHNNFIKKNVLMHKIRKSHNSKKSVSCRFKKTILKQLGKTKLCEGCVWDGI